MSEDWSAVAADVSEGIIEAGMSATLLRPGDAFQTEWGRESLGDTPHDCKLVLMEIKAIERASLSVEGAEMRALIAPDIAVEPNTGDALQVADDRWEILQVDKTAPAGIAVLFSALVKRV